MTSEPLGARELTRVWGVGVEILSLHFVPFQNDQRAAGGEWAGASIGLDFEIASLLLAMT